MKGFRKKVLAIAMTAGISMGVSTNANALYSVIDKAQISTIQQATTTKVLEMMKMVGQQVMQLNLDKMLATLQMQNDQNIAANEIMRTTQVMADTYNMELARSIIPSRGICGNVSASIQMGAASCDVNTEQTKVAVETASRHMMTADEIAAVAGDSTLKAQVNYKWEQLKAANEAAAGSRMQNETAIRGIMGETGNLTENEFDVITKTIEMTTPTAKPMLDPAAVDTEYYAQEMMERQNTILMEQMYKSALLRAPLLNKQPTGGGASYMSLLQAAVNQYYGSAENAKDVNPAARVVDATATGAPVELAIKELLNVESLGLYIDYMSFEQSLRIEALLGMLVKQGTFTR
jgi:hypothetical protein